MLKRSNCHQDSLHSPTPHRYALAMYASRQDGANQVEHAIKDAGSGIAKPIPKDQAVESVQAQDTADDLGLAT